MLFKTLNNRKIYISTVEKYQSSIKKEPKIQSICTANKTSLLYSVTHKCLFKSDCNWVAQFYRKREKMVKSIKSRVTEQLQNFANETSIHGICFVAQPAQPRLKRAIWFVLVSISLMYAGIQITNVLKGKFYF